jgi:hypothetical protein
MEIRIHYYTIFLLLAPLLSRNYEVISQSRLGGTLRRGKMPQAFWGGQIKIIYFCRVFLFLKDSAKNFVHIFSHTILINGISFSMQNDSWLDLTLISHSLSPEYLNLNKPDSFITSC